MLLLYMVHVLHVPGCAVWGFSTWEHVLCPGWCSWGSAGVLWEPHIAFPWTGIRLSATPRRQKAQGNSFDTCEVNFIRNSWAGLESRCFHHVLYQVLTCCAGTAYSLRKSSANSAYSFVVLPGLPYLQKTVYYIIVNHVQIFFFLSEMCVFFTSQTDGPWCGGPTSYTSTTAAQVAHLHLSASSPADQKQHWHSQLSDYWNVYTRGGKSFVRSNRHCWGNLSAVCLFTGGTSRSTTVFKISIHSVRFCLLMSSRGRLYCGD